MSSRNTNANPKNHETSTSADEIWSVFDEMRAVVDRISKIDRPNDACHLFEEVFRFYFSNHSGLRKLANMSPHIYVHIEHALSNSTRVSPTLARRAIRDAELAARVALGNG